MPTTTFFYLVNCNVFFAYFFLDCCVSSVILTPQSLHTSIPSLIKAIGLRNADLSPKMWDGQRVGMEYFL